MFHPFLNQSHPFNFKELPQLFAHGMCQHRGVAATSPRSPETAWTLRQRHSYIQLVPLTKKLLKKACLRERLRFASKKTKWLQRKDTQIKHNYIARWWMIINTRRSYKKKLATSVHVDAWMFSAWPRWHCNFSLSTLAARTLRRNHWPW